MSNCHFKNTSIARYNDFFYILGSKSNYGIIIDRLITRKTLKLLK